MQPAHDLCQADARRSFAASVAVSSYLIKIATKGGSKGTFDQKAAKINTGQFATLSSIAAASPSGNRMCAGSRALLGRDVKKEALLHTIKAQHPKAFADQVGN